MIDPTLPPYITLMANFLLFAFWAQMTYRTLLYLREESSLYSLILLNTDTGG